MSSSHHCDVLISGSGVAGLTAALALPKTCAVTVICKSGANISASYRAQGGIAAVTSKHDSIESHIEDTLTAGAGLCHREAVNELAIRAGECIRWLQSLGVNFSQQGQSLHLGREGGHSHRRILHVDDQTGKALIDTLLAKVKECNNIKLITDLMAIDLVKREQRCAGLYALNLKSGEVMSFSARATILATGGASWAYLNSTAPSGSCGDGIAMAWRAGCRVTNLEFIQFHPTRLFHPKSQGLLISEVLRGEGGQLLLPDGERFMSRYDSRMELAPRDIVARAIDSEIKRLGSECVYLDITHLGTEFIKSHFPEIYKRCLSLGLDITRQQIPVVPAAHYSCGGILIDRRGRTDLKNLYAAGEVAGSGIHGANRLASNSLLECLVYGRAVAEDIANSQMAVEPLPIPAWDQSLVTRSDEDVVLAHNRAELRRCMWDYVGIVRNERWLRRAAERISVMRQEMREHYARYQVSGKLLELRNLLTVAELIVNSALNRRESRGLHYRSDYPTPADEARDTRLIPPNAINSG